MEKCTLLVLLVDIQLILSFICFSTWGIPKALKIFDKGCYTMSWRMVICNMYKEYSNKVFPQKGILIML